MNSKAIIGFEGDEFYSRNAAELGLAGKTFQVRQNLGTFGRIVLHFLVNFSLENIFSSLYIAAVQDSGRVSEK